MMMICSCASSAAMEQDAIFQRIISLTEAATTAALAAEQTLSQIHSMSSSTPASSEGLQAASRILKADDTFSGDDPMQFASWRLQFTSWLMFGDSRYTMLLEKVEAMTSAPSLGSHDAPEKELAQKLLCWPAIGEVDVPTSSRPFRSLVMVLQFGISWCGSLNQRADKEALLLPKPWPHARCLPRKSCLESSWSMSRQSSSLKKVPAPNARWTGGCNIDAVLQR